MYKDVLRSIADISIFPVIAFILFFSFFILLLIYVVRMDKKEVNMLAALPLQQDDEDVVFPHTLTDHQPA